MSLLAPLYFFGALAIGLPILFHMIRRRPKGEVQFSSLMFLRPTPPRLTRKSRLDNLPLLLIRALALILLAIAFARPFLRSTAQSDAELAGRRMVMMIDTSASMQREGLWQQTIAKANQTIADLQAADQLSIVAFDDKPKTVLSFEESSRLKLEELRSLATNRLAELSPTWRPSHTGQAISYAADMAVAFESEDPTNTAQLILISDMQTGSQIESLQTYDWPDELRLDIQQVSASKKTNASAQILVASSSEPDDEKDSDRVRVRVTNSRDATESEFRIEWSSDAEDVVELPVQVPPGQSRVVRMPPPPARTTSLVLQGDDHSFDNTRFLVNPQPQSLSLLHIGDDQSETGSEPRDSLLYYLQRVPLNNPRRNVTVQSNAPEKMSQSLDAKLVRLVVVEEAPTLEVSEHLKTYVASGGRVLFVLSDPEKLAGTVDSIGALTGSERPLKIEEADVADYAMFTRIDFSHPVFAPMADPQFNDFTKIKVWAHRKISDLDEGWQVLTQFDNADPALIERSIGDGRIWVLATGWQPQQSQLALSTKFIPLIYSLFDSSQQRNVVDQYTIGQPIDLEVDPKATITKPSGQTFPVSELNLDDTIDQPGIYVVTDGDELKSFAVNVSDAESRTEVISETELERFGVTLGKQLTTAQREVKQRQLRDIELEGRQRLWQWLLVAALAMLALETWLGGWISRRTARGPNINLETTPNPST